MLLALRNNDLLKLIACIVTILTIGFLSGISTASEIATWYAHIQKPSFNPPNFIFGPVWTLLYVLMGISFYRLIRENPSKDRNRAIRIFCFQLLLNLFWSYIFFNLHAIGLAFMEILIMLVSIVGLLIFAYRVDKLASIIQIPYLLWVTFASILNGTIFFLN